MAPTGTNLSYRKNQLRFLAWATQNNVSCTFFSPVELVDFLADVLRLHHLQASTLKALRRLAMAAIPWPSDLARIPCASCSISDNRCRLVFQVLARKETRGKCGVIKPFTVNTHASDEELCPVKCFKALRDHPCLTSRPPGPQLFVKSHLIHQPLSSSSAAGSTSLSSISSINPLSVTTTAETSYKHLSDSSLESIPLPAWDALARCAITENTIASTIGASNLADFIIKGSLLLSRCDIFRINKLHTLVFVLDWLSLQFKVLQVWKMLIVYYYF